MNKETFYKIIATGDEIINDSENFHSKTKESFANYSQDIIKRINEFSRNGKFDKNRDSVKWDISPNDEYFAELLRVSKNQIIWGSNYFNLPPTRCNIIWHKMQEFSGSDFELAWTSFDKASRRIQDLNATR